MKKPTISKLFLYRHRFKIGYILLTLAFMGTLLVLPLISPNGLSTSEMESTVASHNFNLKSMTQGSLVNAPYHLLQKLSIETFGLNSYSIKLPSIILGFILALLLIMLLNRWFKNNVAIMASVITVISSSFLSVSGFGTPLIMFVFWPTLLLWLGSKIQGEKKPNSFAVFIFAFALLGAIFTPYLIYLAIFIVLYTLTHPHLRFTIKKLPKFPLIFVTLVVIGGIASLVINSIKNTDTLVSLFFMKDFSFGAFWSNIQNAYAPFLSWNGLVESTFLAPLIGLASLALAIIGLISTRNGFLASRNSIATYLIIFTTIISGFCPDFAILLILPLAILIAHGLKYILNKWYSLFPENPYARIFGIFPIAIFLGIICFSDISHFVFGYRYNPIVANQFTNDLSLINNKLEDGTVLLVKADTTEYHFYKLFEDKTLFKSKDIKVSSDLPKYVLNGDKIATLEKWDAIESLKLSHIITNEKTENADRIYVYTADISNKPQAELKEPGNK